MKRTYDDLQNKFQEISADLYKQAAAAQGAQAGAAGLAGTQSRSGAEPTDRRSRARITAMWSTRNSKSSTKTRSNVTTICRQPLVTPRAVAGTTQLKQKE